MFREFLKLLGMEMFSFNIINYAESPNCRASSDVRSFKATFRLFKLLKFHVLMAQLPNNHPPNKPQ